MRHPCWKVRYLSRLTLARPSQSAVKPPWLWPATPMREASTYLLQAGSLSRKSMSDIDRTLLLARYAMVES